MDADQASLAQPVAAALLLAALVVVSAGIVALFLVLRGRMRRDIPPRAKRPKPPIPDAWAEAGARAEPEDDRDDGEPDDDDDLDDDDDDDDGPPMPPVPETPSLSCKA